MKVIKPRKLGVVTRCFEYQRRFFQSFAILALHRFGGGLSSEADMWLFLAQELGSDSSPDAGMPKTRSEFLATGYAFAPAGAARPAQTVRVQLGTLEKTLYVYGDRYWRVDGKLWEEATEAEPYTQMPITWERAFGGPGFERNPRGKGFAAIETEQGRVHALPNLELPGSRVGARSDRPEPAGMGAIDFAWPQRSSKAGTYDDDWLRDQSPGLASDIDWSIFNLAPEDQQQDSPFRGDEAFRVDGMHPTQPTLTGRLPGIVARCFVNTRTPEGDVFQEIPALLTTVWFFPHAERCLLVFHGWREVLEEDAADVLQSVVAAESFGAAKPVEHYQEELAQRLDPDHGPVRALEDEALLPAGLPAEPDQANAEMDALLTTEGLLSKHQRKRQEREVEEARAFVAGLGLDPDLYAPEPLPPQEAAPSLKDVPRLADEMMREGERQREEEEERQHARKEELRTLLTAEGLDADAILSQAEQPVSGPPRFSAAEELEKLRTLSAESRARGFPVEELDAYVADPEYNRMLQDAEQNMREGYRQAAHLQAAAPRFSGDDAKRSRAAAQATLEDLGHLAGVDLTGFDLSGLNLRGVDLHGAWLENANLRRTNLEGANLSGAVLARADLTDALLTHADLRKANLGLAQLVGTRAEGAAFSEAILVEARLENADLRAASFDGADLRDVKAGSTDMSNANLAGTVFLKLDLRGLRLAGADLSQCMFIEVDARSVDFSGASLEEATFQKAQAAGAVFSGARVANARFVDGCAFERADFRGADLRGVNLRGAKLIGSDFSDASLTGADLSECELSETRFVRATACDARFNKANLIRAQMASINLMAASLQHANLAGADLHGANLFQADLARVTADSATNVRRANRKKARFHPRIYPL